MAFIEKNWMLVLALFASGLMLLWPLVQRRLSPAKEIGTLNVTQLINRENAVLLDVREVNEFEGGKLPNAVHIPLSQLGSRMGELAKMTSRPIVVYCSRGQRSGTAGAALAKQGFAISISCKGALRRGRMPGCPLNPPSIQ
jgi:rhodanese-related sulfurtransferase